MVPYLRVCHQLYFSYTISALMASARAVGGNALASVYPNPSAALTQGRHQLSLKSLLAAPQVKRLSRGSDYGRRGDQRGIGSPLSAIKTIELQTARVAGLIKRALSAGKEYVWAVRDNLRRAAKRLLADQSAPLPPPPGPGPVNLHLH